jgi:putative sterol carrier protein
LKNNNGSVTVGASSTKADIVMNLADEDFVSLSQGKASGQKLFMSGKLKLQGQMMLATKLDSVLKKIAPKSKL